jgi:hypothetical protein
VTEPSPDTFASQISATGRCLCGAVSFALAGRLPPVGMCHCSKCRRVSGVGSNAVLAVRRERFAWLSGEDEIQTFALPSGWSTAFCRQCGSPAPQPTPDGARMWVPAGGLDGDPDLSVSGHIHVASKPRWAVIGDDAPQFDEAP